MCVSLQSYVKCSLGSIRFPVLNSHLTRSVVQLVSRYPTDYSDTHTLSLSLSLSYDTPAVVSALQQNANSSVLSGCLLPSRPTLKPVSTALQLLRAKYDNWAFVLGVSNRADWIAAASAAGRAHCYTYIDVMANYLWEICNHNYL